MDDCLSPVFFDNLPNLRDWFEKNHRGAEAIWIGFYRKNSGRSGLTYAQAVDEALCYGWIDGIKKKLSEISYTHRFTPRRRRSHWSLLNVRRVGDLTTAGRMRPAGLEAFAAREPGRTGTYSFERAPIPLDGIMEAQFKRNKRAWTSFNEQPPGYRRLAVHWIMSAKRAETRSRRFDLLLVCSSENRRLPIAG